MDFQGETKRSKKRTIRVPLDNWDTWKWAGGLLKRPLLQNPSVSFHECCNRIASDWFLDESHWKRNGGQLHPLTQTHSCHEEKKGLSFSELVDVSGNPPPKKKDNKRGTTGGRFFGGPGPRTAEPEHRQRVLAQSLRQRPGPAWQRGVRGLLAAMGTLHSESPEAKPEKNVPRTGAFAMVSGLCVLLGE